MPVCQRFTNVEAGLPQLFRLSLACFFFSRISVLVSQPVALHVHFVSQYFFMNGEQVVLSNDGHADKPTTMGPPSGTKASYIVSTPPNILSGLKHCKQLQRRMLTPCPFKCSLVDMIMKIQGTPSVPIPKLHTRRSAIRILLGWK